ncbi:MAG TPA: hypothetical protein VGG71_01720, partial [Chitinophagaceae bacterium]
MDIKEYIQSGVIEQYVLGLATNEEATELEQLRAQYPELNEAVLSFEKNLEVHLTANKIQPPAHIKAQLEKKLFGTSSGLSTVETPVTFEQRKKAPIYNIGLWKYLAAACIVLLMLSTGLNFYFYSGYKNSKEEYQ